MNLPDFILVGAAKSGTTTIYRILADHPQVYFPPSAKEPFYFCFGGIEPMQLNDLSRKQAVWRTSEYLDLFSGADSEQLCADASTAYLYRHQDVINNMEAMYGDSLEQVKIMMILRNPVDRAYSHYTFLVRNGFEDLEFEEALRPEIISSRRSTRWGFDYLDYGAYADQVAHYLSRFPQVKVFLMEELNDRQKLINGITDFLELDRMTVGEDLKANPSGIPKNKFLVNQMRKNRALKWVVNQLPEGTKHKILNRRDAVMGKLLEKRPMRSDTRELLKEHYEEEVVKLESILERDLSHWK